LSIPSWNDKPNRVKEQQIKKICADIRSIGKIRASIDIGQKEDIYRAKDELINEMKMQI
jgi:hypothetical protein